MYRWTIYDSWWEMRTHLSFKCNGIKTDPSTHTYTHQWIGQNTCSIFSIHLYRFIQLNALNFKSCPYFFRLYPLFQFIFLRFISAIVYYLSDRQLRHDTPLYGTETAGNSARDWKASRPMGKDTIPEWRVVIGHLGGGLYICTDMPDC